jgi:hypothetical protein
VSGGGEPRDVADLGHEDRSEDRADTGNGLVRLVTKVAGEDGRDVLFEHGDLSIARLGQVTQALDAHPVGVAQVHFVHQGVAAHAEEPLFGQHRVDLGLEARALVDELGPIADVLAQWWWSDPRLGQAAQP